LILFPSLSAAHISFAPETHFPTKPKRTGQDDSFHIDCIFLGFDQSELGFICQGIDAADNNMKRIRYWKEPLKKSLIFLIRY